RAGKHVVGTVVGSAAVLAQVAPLVGQVVGALPQWAGHALEGLRRGVHALRRALARAWRLVVFKLQALVGASGEEIGRALHDLGDFLSEHVDAGAGRLLGRWFAADDVVRAGDALISGDAMRGGVAARVGQDVEQHHKHRTRAVPILNKVLPFVLGLHVVGVPLGPIGAAALVVFSAWTVHDHIDSPVAKAVRIPGNPGILRGIRAALP